MLNWANKFKSSVLLATLLATTTCTQRAFALEEQIRNYRGIRSAGMGGVITTTGNYAEALFGNPARHSAVDTSKWSLLDITTEVNSNLLSSMSDLNNVTSASGSGTITAASNLIGKNQHARAQIFIGHFNPQLFENLGFAIGMLASAHSNLLINYTTDVDTQTIADVGPAIGVSHSFLNGKLLVGLNLRLLYRVAVADTIAALDFLTGKKLSLKNFGHQGIGLDGDLGGYYRLPWEPSFMRVNVGASINNLLKSHYGEVPFELISGIDQRPINNDRVLNMGVRFDFPDTGLFKAPLFAIELQDIGSTTSSSSVPKKLHLGGETRLSRVFTFRAGLNQGYLSAGLGIDLPVAKFDFATYGEEISAVAGEMEDRRFLFRFALEI